MIQINKEDIINRFSVYFVASINGKEYYCKKSERSIFYNEFIAEEIAKDYGISHAHYEIGEYNGEYYVMSESVYDSKKEELLSLEDLYIKYNEESLGINLTDICFFINKYFPRNTLDIINKLTDLFLFDALIGNGDRHFLNICFIRDKETNCLRLSSIFDNESIGENLAINKGVYCIGIDKNSITNDINYLYDFLSRSNEVYTRYFKSKIGIISFKNLDNIFERLECRGITVPELNKVIIKSSMGINKKMIYKVLNSLDDVKTLSMAM